jgi:Zn-dependent peptidase ImmA (M78 family)
LEWKSLAPRRKSVVCLRENAQLSPIDFNAVNTNLSASTLVWARTAATNFSAAELANEVGATLEEVEHWEATGEIDTDRLPLLAEKTKLPFGYFFLPEPPLQKLPISDFRRIGGEDPPPPSRRLLSVIYRCQRRQQWYRDYLIKNGADELPFVGSRTVRSPVSEVAREIAATAKIGAKYSRAANDWEETISRSIENIESAGILVNKVGYSDGYTHNTLSVSEFRGFALSDNYAPLIFVNGADAPPAQMFTLTHEAVHIWLGESAVSNLDRTYSGASEIERFCNAVAAEILVPSDELKSEWRTANPIGAEVPRLARLFRVSEIVIARRGRDMGLVSHTYYEKLYDAQVGRSAKSRKGNYYTNKPYEASRRFSAAIIREIRSGLTLYKEGMSLLGIKSTDTLKKYAETLQISL